MRIEGMKPSEWLNENRIEVKVEMASCELGAWRCPESVTRLYVCGKGTLFSIVKLFEGVDSFPESNDVICIAEFKHPGRNLLEDKIDGMNYRETEELFLHWSTEEEKLLWAAFSKEGKCDRFDLCYFFRTKTNAYERAKKSLELGEMEKIEWDEALDNVIKILKGQGK